MHKSQHQKGNPKKYKRKEIESEQHNKNIRIYSHTTNYHARTYIHTYIHIQLTGSPFAYVFVCEGACVAGMCVILC